MQRDGERAPMMMKIVEQPSHSTKIREAVIDLYLNVKVRSTQDVTSLKLNYL